MNRIGVSLSEARISMHGIWNIIGQCFKRGRDVFIFTAAMISGVTLGGSDGLLNLNHPSIHTIIRGSNVSKRLGRNTASRKKPPH